VVAPVAAALCGIRNLNSSSGGVFGMNSTANALLEMQDLEQTGAGMSPLEQASAALLSEHLYQGLVTAMTPQLQGGQLRGQAQVRVNIRRNMGLQLRCIQNALAVLQEGEDVSRDLQYTSPYQNDLALQQAIRHLRIGASIPAQEQQQPLYAGGY
jgi:hypothetical protein